MYAWQARGHAGSILGGKTESFGPNCGLFEPSPHSPTKIPFWAQFVAKNGSFARFGGFRTPAPLAMGMMRNSQETKAQVKFVGSSLNGV